MPYIKQKNREQINSILEDVVVTPSFLGAVLQNAGELNYALTEVIRGYLIKHGQRYQTMNDIVGALEGAKVEFQRRVVADYESEKIKANGDVY